MPQQRFDEEVVDRFHEITEDDETDALDELWPHVHPNMTGRERARKATLLSLASQADRNDMRGRVHTLLWSEEGGTGKSHIRNWVKSHFPRAVGAAPSSSEAGLKGNAQGEELTGGALRLAHNGVLAIEELDKFPKGDREALFEAMSDGQYEVHKGNVNSTERAEVRVVATANNVEKFSAPLMGRFDFVIEMDEYDKQETVEVTDTIFDNFFAAFLRGEPLNSTNLVREYLEWVEPFEPSMSDEDLATIKNMAKYLIKYEDKHGDIREKEAWLRVPLTIAKLNRRDLTPDDFIRAIELLDPDLDTDPLAAIRDDKPLM